MTEYRKISPEELEDILEKHKLWLNSKEKEGECADLRNSDLSEVDLNKRILRLADFTGALLDGANLSGAKLKGAKMVSACLEMADLSKADLRMADLRDAELGMADLNGVYLTGANLSGAKLRRANLIGTHLSEANLSGADLRSANLSDADVAGVKYDRNTLFRGTRVATCNGDQHFQRFAMDQAYLEEMREGSETDRFFYYLWLVLADCGRTVWRWLGWSFFFIIAFSCIFYSLGEGAWKMAPDGRAWGWLTSTYYSVVTFTTLGFGDITPKTDMATICVMIEVILGYIMLGGLISLMSTKLSRRS